MSPPTCEQSRVPGRMPGDNAYSAVQRSTAQHSTAQHSSDSDSDSEVGDQDWLILSAG